VLLLQLSAAGLEVGSLRAAVGSWHGSSLFALQHYPPLCHALCLRALLLLLQLSAAGVEVGSLRGEVGQLVSLKAAAEQDMARISADLAAVSGANFVAWGSFFTWVLQLYKCVAASALTWPP
jgi:hypothetical protein